MSLHSPASSGGTKPNIHDHHGECGGLVLGIQSLFGESSPADAKQEHRNVLTGTLVDLSL